MTAQRFTAAAMAIAFCCMSCSRDNGRVDESAQCQLYRGSPRPELTDLDDESDNDFDLQDFRFFHNGQRNKDLRQVGPYFFETRSVTIDSQQLQMVVAVFESSHNLLEWKPNLCDGFHPDWLIERSTTAGDTTQYLICMTCHEVIIVRGKDVEHWNLSPEAVETVKDTLPHREARLQTPPSIH